MVPSHLDCETGRGRLGRGKGKGRLEGVAVGKRESDLGFGGLAAGKGESDLGLGMVLFIPFF